MHKLVVFLALAFAFILIAPSDTMQQTSLDILKSKFLPAEFVGMNFTVEDAKKILREKCGKVSGYNETVYLQAHRGALQFMKCFSGLGNLTAIQKEIEIATPIGELDTIFEKYCKKQYQAELCFNNFMTKINPCLNREEKARHSVMIRIASKLLGFMCKKGGDQIVLFIAEKGPECLEENKDNIYNCMNASFADYIPKNGVPDVNNLPQIVVGEKECKDVQDFEKCVLSHLENCDDITPSNIIESLFKFVKNETQCNLKPKLMDRMSSRSAGSTNMISFTIIQVLFMLVLQKCLIS